MRQSTPELNWGCIWVNFALLDPRRRFLLCNQVDHQTTVIGQVLAGPLGAVLMYMLIAQVPKNGVPNAT